MYKLYLDFETASESDLTVCGLDRYATDTSTRVLLLCWALDDADFKIWEPHLQPFPEELDNLLSDPCVLKAAWNAAFERMIFKHVLKRDISLDEWYDPMISARYMSLPGKLELVCEILNLAPELRKIDGNRLKKIFCEPAMPARDTGLFGRTPPIFHTPDSHPKDWSEFKVYNLQDGVSERAIDKKLARFPVPPQEWRAWQLSERINERGFPCSIPLARGALAVAQAAKTDLGQELSKVTGLENTSNVEIAKWLPTQGYPFKSVAKPFVNRALAGEGAITDLARKALTIRTQTSKTADAKLVRLLDMVGSGDRLRHQFSFYGAARTGRFSGAGGSGTDGGGKSFQAHNLPRAIKLFEENREKFLALLERGDYSLIKPFGETLGIVGSALRSVIQAPYGFMLAVSDLGSIENRMAGFLADCDSILRVFREGKDPYLAFACLWFGLNYDELARDYKGYKQAKKEGRTPTEAETRAAELRTISKPGALGASYRLAGGEKEEDRHGNIIFSGLWGYGKNLGVELTRDQAHESVAVFRREYPEVVQTWYDYENAAHKAVRNPGLLVQSKHIAFESGNDVLRMLLPSGRSLHYLQPKLEKREFFGKEKWTLSYAGKETGSSVWGRIFTHGGKLFENADQGLSRDILVNGMFNAEADGLPVVLHVHDEIGALVPETDTTALDRLNKAMTAPIDWAQNLPLSAEGYLGKIYVKG
jgi:DNA polymerase